MPTPQLLIIADDVTGAADSAARCYNAGLTSAIDLSPSAANIPPQLLSTNVLALSTDSRFLPPKVAAERVGLIVGNLSRHYAAANQADQPLRWYKKIDSTLRGNIGAELAAMLPQVTPVGYQPHAIICPAFPAQQRTLVDGYLCYAQLPPRTLHLPTILAAQCTLSVTTIALTTVRAGRDALQHALTVVKDEAYELIVVDAESEDDLAQLCAASANILPHALFCGSAGLVGVLAEGLATQLNSRQTSDSSCLPSIPETPAAHHPMLAVVGSGSTMAQQQIDYLRGVPSITMLEVDPTEPVAMLLDQVERAMAEQHRADRPYDVVLHLPAPATGVALEGPLARQYAAALAEAALAFIARREPATLLIVGGDTAVHLLQRLGIRQLRVIDELLPGMPLTIGEDLQDKHYRIILKAGNHGDVETMATLLGS